MREAVLAEVDAIEAQLVEMRHALHRQPELGGCEQQTAAAVAARLQGLGLAVRTGVGGHGIVADLQGARPGRTLALRGDMDALPITEQSGADYCSQNPGVMHACGHDGHTTVLYGAAVVLARLRDRLAGNVRFLFQPAEETVVGAWRMCDDGAMDGVDGVIGLHGWPGLPLGKIGLRDGPLMASADTFRITITGRGAHAAYPHLSIDPIVTGAQIVMALQTIRSREVEPQHPIVVTVGQFHAGTADNIIPGEARITGTVRTLTPDIRETIPDRLRRIAEGVCAGTRATCEIDYSFGPPPVINDAATNRLIAEAATDVLGADPTAGLPYASMGAEDFAVYLQHAPGAMFRLGLGDVSPLHTPTFDFDDRALRIGVSVYAASALRYLQPAE